MNQQLVSDSKRRCLFLAVIAHAVNEANGQLNHDNCSEAMRRMRQNRARVWLVENKVDFRFICDCAGLDWVVAREKFKRMFPTKEQWQ